LLILCLKLETWWLISSGIKYKMCAKLNFIKIITNLSKLSAFMSVFTATHKGKPTDMTSIGK
jgi:hypothetical protein